MMAYHFTFLGEGQNGIVLLLNSHIEDRRVVKITYADQFLQEAKIAKRLEVLKPQTQAFIAIFGSCKRKGLIPEWKPLLPKYRQDGRAIDWEKYDKKNLLYIFMEHSNFRMAHPNPSAPGGVVFWEHVDDEQKKKLLFILLHGLFVARKKLAFSHNDIHDGQIVLFKRNPEVPVFLGKQYEIRNCRYMPKFIDFGAATINKDKSSDDVAQLVVTFDAKKLFDTEEFDQAAGSSSKDSNVILNLMNSPYFKEFQTQKRNQKISLCIGCLNPANQLIEGTTFHVCSMFCAERLKF